MNSSEELETGSANPTPKVATQVGSFTLRLERPATIELVRTALWARVSPELLGSLIGQVVSDDPSLIDFVVEQYADGYLRDFEVVDSYRDLITVGVDDPTASDLVERLLDHNLSGWRQWPVGRELFAAVRERLAPSYHSIDVARCGATTRKGTRCQNSSECRIHGWTDN